MAIAHLRMPTMKNAGAAVTLKKNGRGRSQKTTSRNNLSSKDAKGVRQRSSVPLKKRIQTAPLLRNDSPEPNSSSSMEVQTMKLEPDDKGVLGDLQYLTGSEMLNLARHIHEPQKLADALGLPTDEVNRIVMLMHRNTLHPNAYFAFDVLKTWRRTFLEPTTDTSTSEQVSNPIIPMADGERREDIQSNDSEFKTLDEMLIRSPLDDLIDVLQSLGYFEAVEVVQQVNQQAKTSKPIVAS